MFHVVLVFGALFFGVAFLAFVVGVLLFAVFAIFAAVAGTTSAVLLVKDKLVKELLFSGFAIIFLTGCACLLPVLMVFADLSARIASACALVFGLLAAAACALGIKNACALSSKTVKTVLIVLFSIVLAVVLIFACVIFNSAFNII